MKTFILSCFVLVSVVTYAQSDSVWNEKAREIGNDPGLNRIPCRLPEMEGWRYTATIKADALPDSVAQRTIQVLNIKERAFLRYTEMSQHLGENNTDIKGYEVWALIEFEAGLTLDVPVLMDEQGTIINTQELQAIQRMVADYDKALELLKKDVSEADSVQGLFITYDCESQRSIFNFDLTEEILKKGLFKNTVRSQAVTIEPADNDVSRITMVYKKPKKKHPRYIVEE